MANGYKISCIAGSPIQYGSWFGPVPKIDFRVFLERIHIRNQAEIKIVSVKGRLRPEDNKHNSWYTFLEPARDVTEQNMQVFRSNNERLYIQAIRDISTGEIIKCWYGDAYAREINVPHLNAHILGVSRYQCMVCKKNFEFPNYLKIHIMYSCPTVGQTQERLHTALAIPKLVKPETCIISNDMYAEHVKYGPAENRTKFEPNRHAIDQTRSHFTFRACIELGPNTPFSFRFNREPCAIQVKTDKYNSGVVKWRNKIHTYRQDDPVQCEDTESGNFSSGKGHLCVFCGKFYSRKYGLKIHLRTHTGYKPLQCKVCQRAFGDPSNLNKHTRLHAQGNTQYRCSFCDKVLVRRRDLVRHLKSRHPKEGPE